MHFADAPNVASFNATSEDLVDDGMKWRDANAARNEHQRAVSRVSINGMCWWACNLHWS